MSVDKPSSEKVAADDLILEMKGITKDFPGVRALDRVDFSLCRGEIRCLLGENGAGKSTLIKVLTGVHDPDAGRVFMRGHEIQAMTPRLAQDMGVSAVYQELDLVPSLSIAENISLGREPVARFGRLRRGEIRTTAEGAFSQLGITVDVGKLVEEIGTDLRQLTEIAKVLSRHAQIVIMDEPTASLNEGEVENLFTVLRNLRTQGISIIYISHRLEEVFQIGDRVTVLRDGKMVGTLQIGEATIAQLVRMMVGRSLESKFPKQETPVGDEILSLKGASSLDGAVRGVDLRLRKGEILGITGIRGSGCKRLARMIAGAEPLFEGAIWVKGNVARIRSPRDAIQAGIGYLPSDRKAEGLILAMSLRDNVTLPILSNLTRRGIIDEKQVSSQAQRYVQGLDIRTPSLAHPVEYLSGGNQQKVVLAKWLSSRADILILDEPTRGIDVGAKVEMYRVLGKVVNDGGGIVMISLEMPELMGMSDRIVVLRDGKVVGEFDPGRASQEEILQAAVTGEEPAGGRT